jgi:hypothetical protein
MSLWCVQIGRHRLRKLAVAALGALAAVAIFGCGRTSPAAFWEPTKDDTAGIKTAVEANKGYFRTGLAELAMTMCDTALPGTTAKILQNQMVGNPFKGRFRLNALQHELYSDSYDLKYTFIAGLDTLSDETTCTVTMAETIPGKLHMHAWEKTAFLRESIIVVPPAETIRLPFYASTMTPCDTVIEKRIDGTSTDGCLLKKVNGAWQLWKMAGGGRFFAPDPNDAPSIGDAYIKSSRKDSVTVDTVALRPDTLHYGIQRLFSVDSTDHQMLTYSPGDWFKLLTPYTNQGDAYDYVYFNGHRYELTDTVKLNSLSPGIYRLSLEHIPATVLWEDNGSYNATVWGMPIRIQ